MDFFFFLISTPIPFSLKRSEKQIPKNVKGEKLKKHLKSKRFRAKWRKGTLFVFWMAILGEKKETHFLSSDTRHLPSLNYDFSWRMDGGRSNDFTPWRKHFCSTSFTTFFLFFLSEKSWVEVQGLTSFVGDISTGPQLLGLSVFTVLPQYKKSEI